MRLRGKAAAKCLLRMGGQCSDRASFSVSVVLRRIRGLYNLRVLFIPSCLQVCYITFVSFTGAGVFVLLSDNMKNQENRGSWRDGREYDLSMTGRNSRNNC